MRLSPLAGGRYWAAVEQFVGALCLCVAESVPEWIVSRGKNGQSAARLDLGAGGLAAGAGNAAQRIINLLFARRNALICNVCGSHYLGCMVAQVQIGGGVGAFDQGGRGSAASAGRCLINPSAAAKYFHIARGSENQAPKKRGGAGGLPQKPTQHTAMTKPRCSQCGLTSTIDCMEEGCPGVAGFHPSTWARPLIQMATDLERYEALILKLSDFMDSTPSFDEGGQIARLICDEAASIQKKRGGA